MSEGRIDVGNNGELRLGGVLDYRSGPLLREQGRGLILGAPDTALVVDCSAVEKSSSVGLSLLLAFMRDAKSVRRPVHISELPSDMLEIAKVSGLLDVLPLDAATQERLK
ncbi:STAS domain-containing protein [Stutzerimonas stutzeri]|uniref:STAS domain-containing protein n=1 Tax=Stutzerimonas sp. S1 TaxID=3030652 RepID=UPI0022255CFE|nr:STAS domain-containing protein [Stutzerimonas sp. S1]MCW3149837.1 STAS domain-containing protein [Stutzerimonas sp. S1]